jgi:hypothetical protein
MKKKEVLGGILFFIPMALMAQTSMPVRSADTLQTKNEIKPAPRIITFRQMDQRKIYHWANGQSATPTGREAGEHVSNWVRLIGDDSAMVVQGPVKRQHS